MYAPPGPGGTVWYMIKINRIAKSKALRVSRFAGIAAGVVALSMMGGGTAFAHEGEPIPGPVDTTEIEQPAPEVVETSVEEGSNSSQLVVAVLAGGAAGVAVVGSLLVLKKKK